GRKLKPGHIVGQAVGATVAEVICAQFAALRRFLVPIILVVKLTVNGKEREERFARNARDLPIASIGHREGHHALGDAVQVDANALALLVALVVVALVVALLFPIVAATLFITALIIARLAIL